MDNEHLERLIRIEESLKSTQKEISRLDDRISSMSNKVEGLNTIVVKAGGAKWAILAMGATIGWILTNWKNLVSGFS